MMPCTATELDNWNGDVRRQSLLELAGEELPEFHEDRINLHCHSFFSYNCNGWSPSRVAWELRKAGVLFGGLVDFDVLDGMDEFHDAGRLLGIRTNVSLETRTFNTAFGGQVLDSPGEPGVSYVCASGFVYTPQVGTPEKDFLDSLRQTASERNLALLERIHAALPEIAIDYETEVLPLSPGESPTERHMVDAYLQRLDSVMPDQREKSAFLADLLGVEGDDVEVLLGNPPALAERVRARLAKRGGIGYRQPGPDTFPPLKDFFSWARSCGVIPMESWLDGTSEGESDPEALFEASRAIGAVALNIIPDRNWNLKDPEERARKVGKLNEVIKVAQRLGWPIQIGTELNKLGQPLYDDLTSEALAPHTAYFEKSARVLVGHCLSARYARLCFGDPKGKDVVGYTFENDWDYFIGLSLLGPPSETINQALSDLSPSKALSILKDSIQAGHWIIP